MSLHASLVDKNKYYIDLANQQYKLNLPYPTILCNITGKTGGWAKPHEWTVNYNPHFLKNHTEDFLVQTVGHEIAHLVASKLGGRRHDHVWKSVMYRLGLNPDRTHDYDTTTLPKYVNSTYVYACECRDHPITERIHKSILQGRWRKCSNCKGRLTLKSKPVSMGPVTATTRNLVPLQSPHQIQQGVVGMINESPTKEVLTSDKKVTNKSQVEDIMVRYYLVKKTDAELITIIQNILGVTRSNASVYLYNYRKG